MIEVPVFDQTGKKLESLQVDEAKLGGTVRKALLKQTLVAYHANKRQGTVQTLARGEVAGSTRKMFRRRAPATPARAAFAIRSRRAAATPSKSGPRIGGRQFPRRSAGWRATARF